MAESVNVLSDNITPTILNVKPFPRSEDLFKDDNRIAFSKVTQKWILEDETGEEWEWIEPCGSQGRWIQVISEEAIRSQQQAYIGDGDQDAEIPDPTVLAKELKKKRRDTKTHENLESSKRARTDTVLSRNRNTAIYISNLPYEITVEDLHQIFSKFGLISESETGEPRIKIYKNHDGSPKGDALLVYFRPESVDLAIQMMDDSELPPTSLRGQSSHKISVKEADPTYKKIRSGTDDTPTGAVEISHNPKDCGKREISAKHKKKLQAKRQQMESKLTDWGDDEPKKQTTRSDHFVILKHMFTLEELKEDPAAYLDIKEDIREECNKLGNVTNVVLYDNSADGVVKVRFSLPQSAKLCASEMNNRHFGGRVVEAYVWDGREKFDRCRESIEDADFDNEDNENDRLESFGNWIENN